MTTAKTKQTKQATKPTVEPLFRPRVDFRIAMKDGSVHDVFTTPKDSLTFASEFRATFDRDPKGDGNNEELFFMAYVVAKRHNIVASWDEFLDETVDLGLMPAPPLL